jgi:uncharacterized protein YdhG (YjbR/CyaY superfamily)
MADSKKTTKATTTGQKHEGFSADERAAMKDHAQELQKAARRGTRATKADGEADALAKIAEMPPHDRDLAQRLHTLITSIDPDLETKTWYGMPAYAKNGTTICFFQSAHKFKSRYATLGFSDKAALDNGDLWPVYYALQELTPATETQITQLIRRALS